MVIAAEHGLSIGVAGLLLTASALVWATGSW